MATYTIDKIKYTDTYKLLDSGATHNSNGILIGTTGDFKSNGTVYADNGIFNYIKAVDGKISNLSVDDLKAKRATVAVRLDVEGELHTNSWTASNISTIDGAFYITPTISCESGTFNYDGTEITVTAADGKSFAIDDLYMGGSSTALTSSWWTKYSYVIITGDVRENTTTGEWKPLGTIRGNIYSASPSSIVIDTLTDSRGSSTLITLQDIGTGNRTFRNIKISLYKRATSSTVNYPIGIYMTAMGTKGKTFLDIYGGDNQTGVDISNTIGGVTHNSGALAKPKVRIGNLLGLPALTLPNGTSVNPTGWGIYTNNGFFEGTIVSQQGKIGNFTLGTAIYGAASGTGPSTISATTAGTYLGTDGFRNNKSGDTTTYVRITNGVITAKGADITGAITATSLTLNSGVTVPAGNVSGLSSVATTGTYSSLTGTPDLTVYVAKDGAIGTEPSDSSASTSTGFKVSSAGLLKAANAVITGKIFASSGTIGGWNIGTDTNKSLYYGNQTPGYSTTNLVLSSTSTINSNAIGGSATGLYWFISAGRTFGVTTAGKLYASGANINGAITATSLKIGSGTTDYANDITTISSKASGDAEYEVVIKVSSINYATSSATLIAIPTKLGASTTGTFTWYKNAIGTAHGGTVSTTTNTNDTLTVTNLDALYIAVLQ